MSLRNPLKPPTDLRVSVDLDGYRIEIELHVFGLRLGGLALTIRR